MGKVDGHSPRLTGEDLALQPLRAPKGSTSCAYQCPFGMLVW